MNHSQWPFLKEEESMNSPETRLLPNAADKAALKAIAASVVQSCPSLQDTAHEVASDLLKQQGLQGIDPNRVYFHRFKAAQSSAKTFTGWEHILEKPYETLTLTQLVIHRFRVTDKDNADLLDLYAGFYTAGPDAENFNETNEVRLHGNEVLKAFWDLDFSTLYTDRLSAFWGKSADDFRLLAKCNFLSNAVQALEQKQLAADDFQRVIDAVAGPVTWPVSLKMLHSTRPVGHEVRALDVAGYVATDVLRIVGLNGRQIVYLPGETNAFHIMETETDMHWWVLEQMNEGAPRKAFMTHFPLSERHEIDQNITDIMNRLVSTWGRSDHHLINQANQPVKGDAFSWLRESTRSAMYAEARLSLTSNGYLRKKLWIGYLGAGLKVFGPMAAVGWPVALPVIGASIASMGLNIDQAVNGKTTAERKEGIIGAVLSGIDVLFNIPFLKGTGATLEVGAQIEAAEAAEMAELAESLHTAEPATETIDAPEVVVGGEVDICGHCIEEPVTTTAETRVAPEVPARYQCNEVLEESTSDNLTGKFQGIHRLDSDPPYAILMNDNAYYVHYFQDSRGGGYWAIVDPDRPNQFVHSLPVRLNAEGHWERMRSLRLNGGGQCMGKECAVDIELDVREPDRAPSPGLPVVDPQPSTSQSIRLVNTAFDVQPSLQASLRSWALDLPTPPGEASPEGGANPGVRDPYDHHFHFKHEELLKSAQRYFSNLPWANLPPRPAMPSISRAMPIADLIERIFETSSGLVVGETLNRISSMRFMIENMPALARHAKTLYMRRLLSDFAQTELNAYYRTGTMSLDLKTYLSGLGTDPAGRFNELELVKVCRRNGVRIQALECAVIYKARTPFSASRVQTIANYIANDIMTSDKHLNNPGKWVVLTGAENTNTFRGVSGISELQGGIGLRIEEVNPGEATGVDIDPGIEVSEPVHPDADMMRGTYAPLHADLRLRMQAPPVSWNQQQLEHLLRRQGMYLFDKSAGNYTLVHRSGQGFITRTPVQRLADGHFSVSRPSWPWVNNIPFASVEELSHMLTRSGLTLQSRIPD
jgi:hypothetical protein